MIDPRKIRQIGLAMMKRIQRANRRKPPETGVAIPAVPPKGPLPLEGGAEAPLD